MLSTVYIENFGIINQLNMEFDNGLNVITGETGSGKSIILDAILVVLGGRASTNFIRADKKKAIIEAVFNIKTLPLVNKYLNNIGIESEEDGTLILYREITRSSRNVCRINNRNVTLTIFKEFGRYLIDFHGQHQQQSLLYVDKHCQLLDNFGGKDHLNLLQQFTEKYKEWRKVHKEFQDLIVNEKDKIRRIDMLQYQIDEIEHAQLKPKEDYELESNFNFLVNAEKIIRLINDSYTYLYDGEASSVVELLGITINALENLMEYDPKFLNFKEMLENTLYQIEDISRDLSDYRSQIEFDPQHLSIIEDRLDLINKLKYKYGDSVDEILLYKEKAQNELNELNENQEKIDIYSKLNTEFENKLHDIANKITVSRQKIAEEFQIAISNELQSLEMPNTKVMVQITTEEYFSTLGKNKIEFLFTSNPGEPLRPLAKIASGGEISRVMLALKSLLAELDEIPTLVFDEVDSGIGGRALQAVAEKLTNISCHRQVICVTHAVPIACYADKHFSVSKHINKNVTFTNIKELETEERINELARMLGGKNVTNFTREHARHLLETSGN